jgi:hypothetical protein
MPVDVTLHPCNLLADHGVEVPVRAPGRSEHHRQRRLQRMRQIGGAGAGPFHHPPVMTEHRVEFRRQRPDLARKAFELQPAGLAVLQGTQCVGDLPERPQHVARLCGEQEEQGGGDAGAGDARLEAKARDLGKRLTDVARDGDAHGLVDTLQGERLGRGAQRLPQRAGEVHKNPAGLRGVRGQRIGRDCGVPQRSRPEFPVGLLHDPVVPGEDARIARIGRFLPKPRPAVAVGGDLARDRVQVVREPPVERVHDGSLESRAEQGRDRQGGEEHAE